ncbi:MAG: acyltransferase family protein [Clostridia bacterium]|nr:acyltransferase family protein [Clostridia bacterium]
MIFCISFLRALAAMIITNAHYQNVYPLEIIANGGLLGDVIFFAVSGFCLYNIKMNFGRWYLRRIVRVYPAVIIITAAYLLLGLYTRTANPVEFFRYFIYPTEYHFIASIVVLYIPYYFVIANEKMHDRLPLVMFAVLVVYGLLYLFVYDKSYYHIDMVREPMIRFLFFEAMLLGAYFRKHYGRYCDMAKAKHWVLLLLLFCLYFTSKMVFVRVPALSFLQIVNQLLLLALLYSVMRCFIGINGALERLPGKVKKVFKYLAEITLEIYVVQYAIIPRLAGAGSFPINWIVVTVTILAAAAVLHFGVKLVDRQTDKLFVKKS